MSGVKTHQFWSLLGVMLTLGVGSGIIMNHSITFIVDKGYGPMTAAFTFSLAGLFSAIGRLGGFLADRLGRKATFTIDTALYILNALGLLTIRGDEQF